MAAGLAPAAMPHGAARAALDHKIGRRAFGGRGNDEAVHPKAQFGLLRSHLRRSSKPAASSATPASTRLVPSFQDSAYVSVACTSCSTASVETASKSPFASVSSWPRLPVRGQCRQQPFDQQQVERPVFAAVSSTSRPQAGASDDVKQTLVACAAYDALGHMWEPTVGPRFTEDALEAHDVDRRRTIVIRGAVTNLAKVVGLPTLQPARADDSADMTVTHVNLDHTSA